MILIARCTRDSELACVYNLLSAVDLISKPFTSYTYEQKIEIKQLGRPTPELKGLINKAKRVKMNIFGILIQIIMQNTSGYVAVL
jgi:hypothetical protein